MINQQIGKKIRALRAALNLTTSELAESVGISQAQVSRLENGLQGFRGATLSRISDALDVHVAFFFIEESGQNGSNIYAAMFHPCLTEAIRRPRFLKFIESLAVVYSTNRTKCRACGIEWRRHIDTLCSRERIVTR